MEPVQYVPVSAKALEGLRQIATERNCTLAEAVEWVSFYTEDYVTRWVAKLLHQELLRRGVDH